MAPNRRRQSAHSYTPRCSARINTPSCSPPTVARRSVSTKRQAPILHVINRFRRGGAELQLAEIVARSSLRHEVMELEPLGTSTWSIMASARRRLRASRPNVVMSWLDRPQMVTAIAAQGVVRVANICGLPRRRPGVDEWMFRLALARHDCFVANSEASRAATVEFARPFRLAPFHVIPNGVELERGADHRKPSSPHVGFIGRPGPDKGLDVLLDALERLPHVSATFVGQDVPLLVGRDPRAAKRDWRTTDASDDPWSDLGSIDALVVPSRSEGSPNVILEAFARQVPIVATSVGGIPELVGSGRGVLVPTEDPEALAAAILRVVAQPPETTAALSYAAAVHGWERIVAGYDALFEQLLRAQ